MNIAITLPVEAWCEIITSLEASATLAASAEERHAAYEHCQRLMSIVESINTSIGDLKILAGPRKDPIKVTRRKK